MHTLTIENAASEVGRAAAWLDQRIDDMGCTPRIRAMLQVALEEVLTNIILHAYNDFETHIIEIRIGGDENAVTLETVDDGVELDPAQGVSAEHAPGLEQPEATFARRMMDEVTFSREDGRNHLTMRKLTSE